MTSDGIEVRQAARSEIAAAAEVLARAFSTDPFTRAVLWEPRDPYPLLTVTFESLIRRHYLSHGAVDVAVQEGRLVGAALWAAPGADAVDPWTDLRIMGDLVRTVGLRLVPMTLQELRGRRAHPAAPHWYLYAVGVGRPGHGVGGRLLDHAIHRAGHLPCYLEASTPDSARLYERKGFRRVGTVPVLRGGMPLVQMWREVIADRS